ncbi:unnamed protein product [Haemonchus placei]|uniref:G_PROTEIN_RECEP_F1_2 domain-containing protein n=1 Tax=Haemonchus placei TaxID=6290 RepID=A0A0N4XBY7_HAEPC|nr:unnamed protein product [Haemonchus placei]
MLVIADSLEDCLMFILHLIAFPTETMNRHISIGSETSAGASATRPISHATVSILFMDKVLSHRSHGICADHNIYADLHLFWQALNVPCLILAIPAILLLFQLTIAVALIEHMERSMPAVKSNNGIICLAV